MKFINLHHIDLLNGLKVVHIHLWEYFDSELEKIQKETGQEISIHPPEYPKPGVYAKVNNHQENDYFAILEDLSSKFITEFKDNEHRDRYKKEYKGYLINLISGFKKIDKIIIERPKKQGEYQEQVYEYKVAKVNYEGISTENIEWGRAICSRIFYKQKILLGNIIKELEDKLEQIETLLEKESMHQPISGLKWNKTDTDLLELIVALQDSDSISSLIKGKKLTRGKAIEIFETLFRTKIKDPESKLSRAKNRKETTPFLDSLKSEFEKYAEKKEL